MDIELESKLDAVFYELLSGAKQQKDTTLNVHKTLGIGTQCLVYYVAGVIDTALQNEMKIIYKSKGIATNELLKEDWISYWPKKLKIAIEELQKVYGL